VVNIIKLCSDGYNLTLILIFTVNNGFYYFGFFPELNIPFVGSINNLFHPFLINEI